MAAKFNTAIRHITFSQGFELNTVTRVFKITLSCYDYFVVILQLITYGNLKMGQYITQRKMSSSFCGKT